MSGYASIRCEVDGGLLRLTLNRPEQFNAFTVENSLGLRIDTISLLIE